MIKKIQSIILESNLFVALGVWSLVQLTGLLNYVEVNDFALFSFVSTLLVYSFSILYSFSRVKGYSFLVKGGSLITQKVVFSLSVLVFPFLFSGIHLSVLLMMIPVALVSFLYPVTVFDNDETKLTLRELPFVKVFLIGVSWGLVTVFYPLVNAGVAIDSDLLIEVLIRSFFVIAITIPFDIRDVKSDSGKMKTLPQFFGVRKSKILALLFLLINLVYYINKIDFQLITILLLLTTLVVTSSLIVFSDENKPKYYYVVLLESMSILLFLSFTFY
jgi:hypothetical protein